jgi:LPXTG-motif cell wall-anchored protein
MIRVSSTTYSAIWSLVGLLLGAGWVAYGILGEDNNVFLTVMIIASMFGGAGTAIVFKRRHRGT